MSFVTRIDRLRQGRKPQVLVALLRIFLGFAFVPSGLKKVIAQPFTDPALTGPFHDFLDAFHATGFFYQGVGLLQLTAGFLLMTQRFALPGALLMAPILSAIWIFCWSTQVIPTASVVTLMMIGLVGLLLWDIRKLLPIFGYVTEPAPPVPLRTQPKLWSLAGFLVFALYLLSCALSGDVYRPRGMAWHEPAFYVFPFLLVVLS